MTEPKVAAERRSILPGSTRELERGASVVAYAPDDDEVDVLVVLAPARPLAAHAARAAAAWPGTWSPILGSAYDELFAATPQALSAVRDFAAAHGLLVRAEDARRRTVRLTGSVARMRSAFAVDLKLHRSGARVYRGRIGGISLPASLEPHVRGVFGLDQRPQARPHAEKGEAPRLFRPQDVARIYQFPAGTGAGQTIAIVELGGAFDRAELAAYFARVGTETPPAITPVHVAGAPTPYGTFPVTDAEVMLDIEVVGSIAPAADIRVYFGEPNDRGFYEALSSAIHDDATTVVSVSWGGAEEGWTEQARWLFDELGQIAAVRGITVLVASGDDGASGQRGTSDGQQHVAFPASSPHFVACGGTRLNASGGTVAELVWNESMVGGGASGGGISRFFDVPAYQAGCEAIPGRRLVHRGVPDVAGNADRRTGYLMSAGGVDGTGSGTSAVAPLWAGFIALLNGAIGSRVGFFLPFAYEYARSHELFREIDDGDNACNGIAGYAAHPGWNACTGLGVPRGDAWLAAILNGRANRAQRVSK